MHVTRRIVHPAVRRGRGARWLAAVSASAALAASLLTAAPASAAPNGYLALGDSYATGQAIGGAKGADPACLQSPASYPSQIAADFGLALTDNTCSGAVLDDVFSTSSAGRPPQAGAPADSIGLITLSMGGNDLGFRSVLTNCLAVSATGPITDGAASCREKHTSGGVDDIVQKLTNEVTPKFEATLAKLRTTYPKARILVVGYLPLMPDAAHTPAGGCFQKLSLQGTTFPFVTTDLEWMHSVQRTVDLQFQQAAENTGVEYLSQLTTAADHTVCSASGQPYIGSLELQGLSGATPQSFHPNAAGLKATGQAVAAALQPRDAFQGIRGQLAPLGGDQYQLQIIVPRSLTSVPDVAATKNGEYLGTVKGSEYYYLYQRTGAATRTYYNTITVTPGDQVELRVHQNGTRQVLTPLPDSFQGVTGQLVHTGGTSSVLEIWVPNNTLYTTPGVTARNNGHYLSHVAGEHAWYLSLSNVPGYRVYRQAVTVNPGDVVTLDVGGSGEKQTLS